MRGFVLLICFGTFVTVLVDGLTDEEKQRISAVHTKCQADPVTHVDEEILKQLHKGEHVDRSIVGVHILCMSKNLGFQKENGDIDKKRTSKKFGRVIHDDAKLDETVKICALQKTTPEETALDLLKCFRDNTDHSIHAGHHH
ncbi:hypothetical protein NQ314_014915 [Rhamnusium bicolor]|uniref:Uncharacterized protein n=1 Tax=Rhamnusium bicolor TaxID=1586634 RepID=A0AAV8X029_9CUCU|nr:hypothetical protein NQ314_014915 [Rhamnusium bicolor]